MDSQAVVWMTASKLHRENQALCSPILAVQLHTQNLTPFFEIQSVCSSHLEHIKIQAQFSSVHSLSCVWLFATPWTAARQASLSITNFWNLLKLMSKSVMPRTISFSVIPFSSCLRSFPASGSLPMSQFFTSGGQSIGVSASASVLPMNIQGWFPLEPTGLISLQFKEVSRVFFRTTIQRHQFFRARAFLLFSSHIHTWLLEKP